MPAGRGAPIARHDLADTAAAVLASDGAHDGETFDVTGRERLSLHDIAAVARLAGHDAMSLAAFLRAHPESYAHMTPA